MPIIKLPFQGFYESVWSQEVEHTVERDAEWMAEQQAEEGIAPELRLDASEFAEILSDCLDYQDCYRRIAEAYVEAFDGVLSEEADLDLGLKFESVSSPRYYNFETDRVFAEVSDEAVAELFSKVSKDTLAKVIKERHTSYDGFISYYSNRVEEWLAKPLDEWDHNELETLLLAFLEDANVEDLDWAVYYRVCDGDGIWSDYQAALDWQKVEEIVAEKREEKREAYAEEHPEDPDIPEPRCPYTGDLFATT
jgi:hypothetical protein